jgi:hypothetical protein
MTTLTDEVPERRQFDFWLGHWDAHWETGRGTNTITAELDGVVIMERFDGRPGSPLQGISVSTYDAKEGIWRQVWVDSTGGYLDFTGGVVEGCMELRRGARVDAPPYRMRFVDIERDSFTWRWESWNDDEARWDERWRIDYTRKDMSA